VMTISSASDPSPLTIADSERFCPSLCSKSKLYPSIPILSKDDFVISTSAGAAKAATITSANTIRNFILKIFGIQYMRKSSLLFLMEK